MSAYFFRLWEGFLVFLLAVEFSVGFSAGDVIIAIASAILGELKFGGMLIWAPAPPL
jgi:hypothetical protein